MIELAIIVLAIIVGTRWFKWQAITGETTFRSYIRHEITEIKALFKG